MAFFYKDNSEPFKGGVPLSELDKNRQYKKHLENLMFLEFISKNSKDLREKRQAEAEIPIARRKMAFWAKFPDFDRRQAELDTAELKRQWSGRRLK